MNSGPGTRTSSVVFNYWLVVVLTLSALGFLAYMANQALMVQIQSGDERERGETASRLRLAAKQLMEELPGRLASEPFIPLPCPSEPLPLLIWPDSIHDRQLFWNLSTATESAREHLLEGFLNAEPGDKPLWNFLLARHSLETGDTGAARDYLERILGDCQDFRMYQGFSLKCFCRLLAFDLKMRESGGRDAIAELLEAARLPRPERIPLSAEDLQNLLGTRRSRPSKTAGKEIKAVTNQEYREDPEFWFHLLLWAWNQSTTVSHQIGWKSLGSDTALLLGSPGKYRLYSGDEPRKMLMGAMERSVGSSGEIRFFPAGTPGTETLDTIEGFHFTVTFKKESNPYALSFSRVKLGFLLAGILVGFSFIVMFGIRREQDRHTFAEQEFFYRQAAHDLKTPLTTLKALAETLSLGRFDSREKEAKYFEKVISEVDHAADVVDSMLMAARFRTGIIKPFPEPIDPELILKRIIERFSPRFEGWDIVVQWKDNPELRVDPAMFERVFINLIENALRHAPGGKSLTVTATSISDDRFEIGIGDRGRELSEAGENSSLKPTGSGLGLFLVEKILELHKGTFQRKPRDQGGTWAITRWLKEKQHADRSYH